MRIFRVLLSLSCALPALVGGPAPGSAQEVDDPLSPAGRLRIGMSASLWSAESRFGLRSEGGARIEEVEPMGFDLSHDRLGADVLPGLAPVEDALRAAAGDPTLVVSLGGTRSRVRATTMRFPLQMDLGVTDWLTVGVSVPFVKQRTELGFSFTADPQTANLGSAPGTVESEGFLGSLGASVDEMRARADAVCASDPASAECADARDAEGDGQAFLDALTVSYGHLLFPYEGSATGGSLRARLDALGARFSSHGVTSAPEPDALPLASRPLSGSEFRALVAGQELGIETDSLDSWQSRWEVGDVEVHGALRLLEGDQPQVGGGMGVSSYLLGVGGLIRFATGSVDDPDNFFDRGSGDGQTDLEARVFGDVGLGRRFGLWADVRYGIQMEGTVVRRIVPPDVVLAPVDRRGTVRWDPGDYLELEVAPRLRLTPELALAARYRLFSRDRDRFRAVEESATPDPVVLEEETLETLHEGGISLVYSTLRAARAGRAERPLEARIRYRRAVAGSGGMTPKGSRIEVGLRLFWSLWGN